MEKIGFVLVTMIFSNQLIKIVFLVNLINMVNDCGCVKVVLILIKINYMIGLHYFR